MTSILKRYLVVKCHIKVKKDVTLPLTKTYRDRFLIYIILFKKMTNFHNLPTIDFLPNYMFVCFK